MKRAFVIIAAFAAAALITVAAQAGGQGEPDQQLDKPALGETARGMHGAE